jgi:hypothetical protein
VFVVLVGHQRGTRTTEVSQTFGLYTWLAANTCADCPGGEPREACPSRWSRKGESEQEPAHGGRDLSKDCCCMTQFAWAELWSRVGQGRSRKQGAIGRRWVAAWPDSQREGSRGPDEMSLSAHAWRASVTPSDDGNTEEASSLRSRSWPGWDDTRGPAAGLGRAVKPVS